MSGLFQYTVLVEPFNVLLRERAASIVLSSSKIQTVVDTNVEKLINTKKMFYSHFALKFYKIAKILIL